MPWEVPLTYLPLTWLAYLPAYLLRGDLRITNLLAELGIGLALAWLAQSSRLWRGVGGGFATKNQQKAGPRTQPQDVATALQAQGAPEAGLLIWAWLFLQPSAMIWSLTTTAPVQWLLLTALLVFLSTDHVRRSAIMLGLCAAATPLVSIVIPFALLRWLRLGGWQLALRCAGAAALIGVTLIAPFLIWAPQPFIFGVWRWFNDNNLYPRLRWDMDQTWARMIGFSGMFWRHKLVDLLKPIQLVLILSAAALYHRRRASAISLAPYVTATFLLFTLFNPVLWPYLYNPALLAALVTMTRLGRGLASEGVLYATDIVDSADHLDQPDHRASGLRFRGQ
jgi:hypothetical protein